MSNNIVVPMEVYCFFRIGTIHSVVVVDFQLFHNHEDSKYKI